MKNLEIQGFVLYNARYDFYYPGGDHNFCFKEYKLMPKIWSGIGHIKSHITMNLPYVRHSSQDKAKVRQEIERILDEIRIVNLITQEIMMITIDDLPSIKRNFLNE